MVRVQGRELVRIGVDVDLPLMGSIAFGVIDRGTNIIQVRPISYCVLNCTFCSTDAGPYSTHRLAEYCVWYPEDLVAWVTELARLKGGRGIEAHIDTVGDPILYHSLVDLVAMLREREEVSVISMQTHGATLTYKLVNKLEAAGLNRINLSIDTLNPDKARRLQGVSWFNVERVIRVAEYIAEATSIDLTLAPVLLPGINDEDVEEIIEWGKRIGVGKRWPGFGIQKYVRHKHGRKPKGVKPMSWQEFYEWLKRMEVKHKVKLIHSCKDFGITRRPRAPIVYKRGSRVKVRLVCKGWLKGELIGLPLDGKRVITVVGVPESLLGSTVRVRIIENKDNIYLARPIWA